jgi:hypothetical protein
VAALIRGRQPEFGAQAPPEEIGRQVEPGGVLDEDFGRRQAAGTVIRSKEFAGGLGLRTEAALPEQVAADEPAAARLEHDELGEAPVEGPGHVIPVAGREVDDAGIATERLDRLDSVAKRGRLLEQQRGRRGLHVDPERIGEQLGIAGKQGRDALDLHGVLFPGRLAGAWRGTAADMVVHARRFPLTHRLASPQREESPHEVEVSVDDIGARIRPEVAATVVDDAPGPEYARVFLVRDPDGRVGLAVLQVYVVLRRVLLDQVVLEEEGLVFRLRQNPLERRGLGHE